MNKDTTLFQILERKLKDYDKIIGAGHSETSLMYDLIGVLRTITHPSNFNLFTNVVLNEYEGFTICPTALANCKIFVSIYDASIRELNEHEKDLINTLISEN